MPKRATQVCNEMLSDRNFLRAAEIASVFCTENFLKALYVLVCCILRVKKCFCTQFEVCSSSVIRGVHKNSPFPFQRQPMNAADCENLMKRIGRCWYCPRDFNKLQDILQLCCLTLYPKYRMVSRGWFLRMVRVYAHRNHT
jgi:hypothetical protein